MGFRAGKAGTRHIGHMSHANCNVGNEGPCRQASRLQACSIRAACPAKWLLSVVYASSLLRPTSMGRAGTNPASLNALSAAMPPSTPASGRKGHVKERRQPCRLWQCQTATKQLQHRKQVKAGRQGGTPPVVPS